MIVIYHGDPYTLKDGIYIHGTLKWALGMMYEIISASSCSTVIPDICGPFY